MDPLIELYSRLNILLKKDLPNSFDVDAARAERTSLEDMLAGEFKLKTSLRHSELDQKIKAYEEIVSTSEDANVYYDLVSSEQSVPAEDERSCREDLESVIGRIRTFIVEQSFKENHDDSNAFVTVKLGSCASDLGSQMRGLLNVYESYAKDNGFAVEEYDVSDRSVTLRISGENAYAHFRTEHGAHKICHQNGKRQTGYFSVEVLPELNTNKSVEMAERDLKVEYLSASTPGGQHANKAQTGVRITYLPLGISASSRLRSRAVNLKNAIGVLQARVAAYYEDEQTTTERSRAERGGDHIRTYYFYGGDGVVDRRTSVQMPIDVFFKGGLEPFVDAAHGFKPDY